MEDDLRPVESLSEPTLIPHTKKMGHKEKIIEVLKLHPEGLIGTELLIKCGIANGGKTYADLKLLEAKGLIKIRKCECGVSKIYQIK